MAAEWAEDNRLAACPQCQSRVGKAQLYVVRDAVMCEGCGRDLIREWNSVVQGEGDRDRASIGRGEFA